MSGWMLVCMVSMVPVAAILAMLAISVGGTPHLVGDELPPSDQRRKREKEAQEADNG